MSFKDCIQDGHHLYQVKIPIENDNRLIHLINDYKLQYTNSCIYQEHPFTRVHIHSQLATTDNVLLF